MELLGYVVIAFDESSVSPVELLHMAYHLWSGMVIHLGPLAKGIGFLSEEFKHDLDSILHICTQHKIGHQRVEVLRTGQRYFGAGDE
jgi:hypothetical protein